MKSPKRGATFALGVRPDGLPCGKSRPIGRGIRAIRWREERRDESEARPAL